jgi:heterodisulfide reductase subunit C
VATLKDIRLEEKMSLDFMDEVYALPGGDKVKDCIQCGTCSGSCPASFKMEKTPRQIFSMIRAGMRDEVLSSDTMWLCASCYTCPVRCPKEIKIADVFYAIKRIAIREGKARKNKAAVLSGSFAKLVNKYGRNSEVRLLASYYLKADLFGWVSKVPIAMKLFFKGRLPLRVKKIKGIKQVRGIIKTLEKMQGNGGPK